jgi:hypothetical protein
MQACRAALALSVDVYPESPSDPSGTVSPGISVMASMSHKVECIIVGGGLLGLLSARVLARAGLSVCVLERGSFCRESSWAGGGILSPLVPWDYPEPVSELVRWSRHACPPLVDELRELTGIDPEWTQSGMLLQDVTLDERIAGPG